MIDIIDENGIIDNDCGSNNGPRSLGSGIIEEVGVNNILRMNPIQTKIDVNHCSVEQKVEKCQDMLKVIQ